MDVVYVLHDLRKSSSGMENEGKSRTILGAVLARYALWRTWEGPQ